MTVAGVSGFGSAGSSNIGSGRPVGPNSVESSPVESSPVESSPVESSPVCSEVLAVAGSASAGRLLVPPGLAWFWLIWLFWFGSDGSYMERVRRSHTTLYRSRPSPWMRCRIDFAQPFGRHQRVDLGGRHRRMAEQLLNGPHVGASV